MTEIQTAQETLPVVQLDGTPAGTVPIGKDFLTAPINIALVAQVVLAAQASRRSGTASTKRRAEVRGGGAKPWRQKHTGRARAGSNRSPLWRHGGIVFGPHPRDFRQQLPRRMKRHALLEVVRAKARDGELSIVDGFVADAPSTKAFARRALLAASVGRLLVILERYDSAVHLSLRNLPQVRVEAVATVTADAIVNRDRVLIAREAWPTLMARMTVRTPRQKGIPRG